MRGLVTGCLLLLSQLAQAQVAHAEVYRYTDERGVTVLSRQGVTLHAAKNGYEVLNDQGRVIRVVPPPPTAEDLRRREEVLQQEAYDRRLRELYSNVKDLDTAREHRLRTLDGFVTVIAGNLELTQQQLAALEKKAAGQERGGKAVDPVVLEQIRQLSADRTRLESELGRRRLLRDETDREFAADRERLLELYPQGRQQP